jgi:TolA-binding protein
MANQMSIVDWIIANQTIIETLLAFGAVYFFLRKGAKKDVKELQLQLDQRFDKINQRFDKMDQRFDKMESSFKELEVNLKSEIRQTRIEFKIDELKRNGTEDKK